MNASIRSTDRACAYSSPSWLSFPTGVGERVVNLLLHSRHRPDLRREADPVLARMVPEEDCPGYLCTVAMVFPAPSPAVLLAPLSGRPSS